MLFLIQCLLLHLRGMLRYQIKIRIYLLRLKNYANVPRETCNGKNNLEPFDPRCRPWYVEVFSKKRKKKKL